jgi:uncharacterized protein (TIGR02246 family)
MVGMSTDTAVRDLYTRLIGAWNGRDPDAFAALFAPDGTSIGFDGSQTGTPDGIAAHLRPVFADHPTAAYVAKVREVRPLGTGAALLRAIAGMVPPGARELKPELNTVQSLVAEATADGWRIVLFQNTPARYDGRPDLAQQHTAELAPLATGGTSA